MKNWTKMKIIEVAGHLDLQAVGDPVPFSISDERIMDALIDANRESELEDAWDNYILEKDAVGELVVAAKKLFDAATELYCGFPKTAVQLMHKKNTQEEVVPCIKHQYKNDDSPPVEEIMSIIKFAIGEAMDKADSFVPPTPTYDDGGAD